ncbi:MULTISPECIES: chromosome partitioning protein ParA [Vibrio]|uniref:Chromosome partitioning protein ParA n=2 Tax=Vibrio TaxID=662 RepID=A0A7X4LKX0_9VIBR|nr:MULTISPECIES: chromosome partitioning protein ParA [Vibrio]MBF8999911.1 chromosome partitioning protein ParA [Vibrio nitrifigilis]MZI93481.1 chromosome partitioning protein ParA [Vibrio eleionomae]
MVSINGLPPSISGPNRTTKSRKGRKVDNSEGADHAQPSKVANAVSQSIRHVKEADIRGAQLHYDLPEGRARYAMQEYLDVMNQAKREELAQMLGVDLYI